MVNKEWFKTVSNNLNIIDFDDQEKAIMGNNGSSNEYSIFKIENCKYLKITPWNTINASKLVEKLTNGSFSSLKSLIIQESEGKVNHFGIYRFIDELRNNKLTIDIHLDSILLYTEKIGETLLKTLIDQNVKQIYTVRIYQYENELAILKVFSTWSNSIKRIICAGFKHYSYNVFQLLSPNPETGNINYLKNIKSISISINNGLPLDSTISSLKNAHNLKELSINLCFQTLIYHLSTIKERESLKIQKCSTCSPFIGSIDDDYQDYQKYVNEQWPILCKLFKSNNTLKHLTINCTCNKFEIKYQKLVLEISNLVSSIGSLDKFSLRSNNNHELFKSIVEKNKSITKYYSKIIQLTDGDTKIISKQLEYSISIFNDLIHSNPHITQFKFENYSIGNINKILIDFNKNN